MLSLGGTMNKITDYPWIVVFSISRALL